MSANQDYSDFVQDTQVTNEGLTQLAELASKQSEAELKVAKAEAALQEANKELRDIAERQIPELMEQLGMEEFLTSSGIFVSVKETIRASIPEPNRPTAFAWLRERGYEALLKRQVIVEFGKGDDAKAAALLEKLRESEENYLFDDKTSVAPQTLAAFIREQLQAGVDIPLDLFGAFRQRISKIKLKDGKKKV